MNGLISGSGPMMAEKSCKPMTIRERLGQQEQYLTAQLEKVRAAIAALDANPNVADLFEKISTLNL